jgi:hypothetical protein
MEKLLLHLPDKIVADDITNFLLEKTNKHLFSDIYEGRTILNPNYLIQYNSNSDVISLYEGGVGFGNYLKVSYSIKENKYIYYTINQGESPRENFKSDNWLEFHTYVRKELLDLFIWFNKTR